MDILCIEIFEVEVVWRVINKVLEFRYIETSINGKFGYQSTRFYM